jgi:hypothetical protein
MTWGRGSRNHKYGAVQTEVDGIKFPSKKEAARYTQLRLLERAGNIRKLELQPRFALIADGGQPVKYPVKNSENGRQAYALMDFKYFDIENRRWIVEDVKGKDTPLSKLKRAMVEAQYGVRIVLI